MYIGYQVLNGATNVSQTLDKNTIIGYQAWGTGVPSGTGAQAQENTYLGYQAGKNGMTAGRCTFIGSGCGPNPNPNPNQKFYTLPVSFYHYIQYCTANNYYES